MEEITLSYFPLYARAETARLIFHYHGVEFNNHIIEFQDWPELKTSGFAEFNQLPVLEIDGLRMVQSQAIARYLAQKYGFYPTEHKDIYLVESLCDLKEDVVKAVGFHIFKRETEIVEKWFEENAQTVLEQLERRLNRNQEGNGYFVGDSVTLADFHIFQLVHDFFVIRNRGDLVEKNAPKVLQFVHRFLDSSPRLKAYIESRPDYHI